MNYLELLGIDKPIEWLREKSAEASTFTKENSDTFADMHSKLIRTDFPELYQVMVSPYIAPSIIKTVLLFYTTGYLKGLIIGERDYKLRKLLEEVEE